MHVYSANGRLHLLVNTDIMKVEHVSYRSYQKMHLPEPEGLTIRLFDIHEYSLDDSVRDQYPLNDVSMLPKGHTCNDFEVNLKLFNYHFSTGMFSYVACSNFTLIVCVCLSVWLFHYSTIILAMHVKYYSTQLY